MIAFHKGLIVALKTKLQLVGVRIEDEDAQRLYAGASPFRRNSDMDKIATGYAEDLFYRRHEIMKVWEEEHPGQPPFPPAFPEVVLAKLQAMTDENRQDTIIELIKLAEAELA